MVDTHEVKMISVLISTEQFLATLAYPIKNKIKMPVSKKQVTTLVSIDAAIEVSPLFHGHHDGSELATQFYNILTTDSTHIMTKNKKQAMGDFLEKCGEKVRGELIESLNNIQAEIPHGEINHVFINFIDKSGELRTSRTSTLQDILACLNLMRTRIKLWKTPKKRSKILVPAAQAKEAKPRRKERLKGAKEGGTRRYRDYSKKRAA